MSDNALEKKSRNQNKGYRKKRKKKRQTNK